MNILFFLTIYPVSPRLISLSNNERPIDLLFLETISGKTNEFPIFWRLDSCRPIEFRDGQRDALGILAHRMSEDDVSGCPSSPKRNAGRFLRFHETKVLRRRSDPIRKKTQLQTHDERHDSANFLPGGLFPMSR